MLGFLRKSSAEDILHKLLPELLVKRAPTYVPLTGESAELNDYYSVYFGNKYLVKGYNPKNRVLEVCTPDENGKYVVDSTIALSNAIQHPFHATFFYKKYWQDYTDIHHLARDYKTRWIQFEVIFRTVWGNISQWSFNKKPLWVIRDRMGLLEFIIERHLGPEGSIVSPSQNTASITFSAFQLMTELRSSKWIYHPHSQKAQHRLNLLLDAFVDSGDLRRESIGYSLLPRAIQTLEAYQESERRHTDAIRTQKLIIFFTVIIAFATLVQAYYAAYPAK